MSTSQHPIATHLEGLVGDSTLLLATVMGLPLIDGIFPALILAGMLERPTGVLEVGLLVFGGSATLVVVLAEMHGDPRRRALDVLLVGTVLVFGASFEAALAPTIKSVINLGIFERFAAIVIGAIAAKTASARIGELLPRPGVIVALGLVASLDPTGVKLVFRPDFVLIAKAGASAAIGTAFALTVVLVRPKLLKTLEVERFRFGSAVALGVLPLSVMGVVPGHASLAVLGVAFLFAFNPDSASAEVVNEEKASS